MSAINVVEAFTLTLIREGQLVERRIEVGIQELEDDIASHWYTKAHCEDVPAATVDAESPSKSRKKG